MEKRRKNLLAILALLLIAAVFFFQVAGWLTNPGNYEKTMTSIDSKVDTVLKLTATSTIASAGISALPGDTATPIADKLADFTEYFLLILCVLYSEKYLLTILGGTVCRVLVPVICAVAGISLYCNPKLLHKLAVRLALIGLATLLVIPTSIQVSDMIYDTYQYKIESTITEAEDFAEQAAEVSDAEEQGVLAAFLNQISQTISGLSDKAARIMNNFIESLAVMIVTSCAIPLLVLMFFLWLIKVITGTDLYAIIRPKAAAEADAGE